MSIKYVSLSDAPTKLKPLRLSDFLRVSDPRYTEIEKAVLATYKNACIVWIEEVRNQHLEDRYNLYKFCFEQPNEKRLFHGTSEKNARDIIQVGFDSSKSEVGVYGLGTYFSTKAAYSKNFSKRIKKEDIAYMIVADVVVGRTCQGKYNEPVPNEYDSCTDNLAKPDMYIIRHNSAALPRYVVAFYPNAK